MYQLVLDPNPGRHDGFRLQRLEIYNWGTFNHHVWTLEPGGNTALLTGANGSGKSTLVDALLTLLVPHARRSYNQASGVEKRRERDERTYVRGAYGRVRDGESNAGVIQFLRGKDSYSVLLAVFANQRLGQCVTLAQVFWMQDDGLKKFHVVALRPLSIADHFSVAGDMADLRRRLKSLGAEVHDEFVRYSAHVCKLFGLRSDKALDLFNQVVSIKEIGGLNDFVRAHMLEKSDAQEKIAQLRENYENLTRAHDAILKAQQQMAQLQPLLDEAGQHQQLQVRIAETERCVELVPAYFAHRKLMLLERAIQQAGSELARAHSQRETLDARLSMLRGQERELYAAIANDQAGQHIQEIARDIERTDERLASRKKQAERYDDLARPLGLPLYGDEATFYTSIQQARDTLPQIEERLSTLVGVRDEQVQATARLERACQDLRDEIASLERRTSQIPSEDFGLRSRVAQALGIAEEELPFVGELLKVREDARNWEGAIERLLRGYGRQLLVAEALYRRISAYVDATDLRGRLVYQRVTERRALPSLDHLDRDALPHKLEIKPETPFYDWLQCDLVEHFDYICCETLDQFQRERRALTVNGQIKRGSALHEKDDRYALDDRKRYVLGWDNRGKIAALSDELSAHSAELEAARREIAHVEDEQRQRRTQQQLVRELLQFDSFAAIDWHADERLLRDLEAQRATLEASADSLKQLRDQLGAVTVQIAEADKQRSNALSAIARLDAEIARCERQREDCTARLDGVVAEDLDSYGARIEADLKGKLVRLDTLADVQEQVRDSYTRSAAAFRGQLNALAQSLIRRMDGYKRDYPEDTEDVDAAVESICEFQRMLDRIQREDLPRHARRFKDLLDEKVITSIAIFKGSLEKQVEEIKSAIFHLNESLRRIDYTPSTYIQLRDDPSRDREIQEFRHALRACLPDVGQARSAEVNEASFQRIRALIERFEQEERWTQKVTDVRNWLEFSAEERYSEDHKPKNFYSDSAGKSGGQKAKLAYTILASAIAYQYGLDQDESRARSFRFVVVDEAFSKSDETNARYAMELFKQLNLQLLVVTPLDKTHIVEPYIAACHFVANNEEENDSKVYNLTIQQYHEQKAAFEAGQAELVVR
jgi:uncharacterized protein YPO0396